MSKKQRPLLLLPKMQKKMLLLLDFNSKRIALLLLLLLLPETSKAEKLWMTFGLFQELSRFSFVDFLSFRRFTIKIQTQLKAISQG